jgi:DNA-directed RNA polymerase specialized sigma24 family protein
VLRYYLDLPVDEIAELTGRPAGTIKSQIHRALATLQEVLR